jgi:hypothetical protein
VVRAQREDGVVGRTQIIGMWKTSQTSMKRISFVQPWAVRASPLMRRLLEASQPSMNAMHWPLLGLAPEGSYYATLAVERKLADPEPELAD